MQVQSRALLFAPEAAAAAARPALSELPIGRRDSPLRVGPFEVRRRAFCQRSPYTVYTATWGGHVLGSQLSYPSESDCVTHARIAYERRIIDRETLSAIRKQVHASSWMRVPARQLVVDFQTEGINAHRKGRAQARKARIQSSGMNRCKNCGPLPIDQFRLMEPGRWLNECRACERKSQKVRNDRRLQSPNRRAS